MRLKPYVNFSAFLSAVLLSLLTQTTIAATATVNATANAAVPATMGPMVERFVAGQHYQVLTTPVPLSNPRKIEVIEMFSYGCSHCYEFEGTVEPWRVRLPADVQFRAVPVLFNPQFRALAQAFYTAQALKIADKSHSAMFKALHVDGKPLWQVADMARFYAGYGVSASDFTRTMDSFGVRASIQRSDQMTKAFQITGVPAIVVNGKYVVDGRMAGSNAAMLQVADFLIRKERDAKRKKPAAAVTRPIPPTVAR